MPARQRGGALAALVLLTAALAACGGADERSTPSAAVTPTVRTTAVATPAPQGQGATPTATRTPTPRATRTPARTPTPLPPPTPAIGDTVQTDGWFITVTGFDLYQRVGDSRATGIFLYVRMTVKNAASTPAAFPFDGLVVTDISGRTHFLHAAATRESLTYDFGFDIAQQLAPGEERAVVAIFDIPTDATGLVLTTPSRAFQIRLEYAEQPK